MKKLSIILIAGLGILSSCKKDQDDPIQPDRPESFNELNAQSIFNWSTVKPVSFSITGMAAPINVKKLLVIKSGESVFYNQVHGINDNINITLNIPIHLNKVEAEMGSLKTEINISGTNAAGTFVVNLPEEL